MMFGPRATAMVPTFLAPASTTRSITSTPIP